jgi:CHAD domain-containing protein
MAFVFSAGSAIGEECCRVLLEESHGAVEKLRSFSSDPDLVIHEVRKHNKRIRSLLLLVEPAIGKDMVAPVNALIRDAAKLFSEARDAVVMKDTSAALRERHSGTSEAVDRHLEKKHRKWHNAPNLPSVLSAAINDFEQAAALCKEWPWTTVTEQTLLDGIEANYRRGLEDFAKARESRCPEQCHDWRKRAKYLSYHLTLLEGVSRTELEPATPLAEALASLLGEHHDLEVFREFLESDPMQGEETALLEEAQRRQKEIEEEAFQLGESVYSLAPEEFREGLDLQSSFPS